MRIRGNPATASYMLVAQQQLRFGKARAGIPETQIRPLRQIQSTHASEILGIQEVFQQPGDERLDVVGLAA